MEAKKILILIQTNYIMQLITTYIYIYLGYAWIVQILTLVNPNWIEVR